MTHTIETPPAVPAGEPLPPQVDKLIADLETRLPQGEVPAGIFGHPQVYQTELRKVFGRCWVYLAHDSEIAANGDYVVRKIGEDNFIVSRDEAGQIHVLFDACRHRGVQVCRADSGNTSHFRCPLAMRRI